MTEQSNAEKITKAVEGGVLIKDKRPPIAPENIKTDKWINYPTEHPVAIRGGKHAQQSMHQTALRRGLAVSIFINLVLLAIVLVKVGGW